MSNSNISYAAPDGYIHHWLVAGPVEIANGLAGEVPSLASMRGEEGAGGVTQPVTDLGPLLAGQPEPSWRYYRCQEDHWVDLTAVDPAPTQVQAWAYTGLNCSAGGPAQLVLSVQGCSLEVWINGEPALAQPAPHSTAIHTTPFAANLLPGQNEVLVRLRASAVRETPFRMAMRITGSPAHDLQISLPTTIENEFLALRQHLETVAAAASLDRYVYGYLDGDRYDRNEPVSVRYADDLAESGELTHRLQSLAGDIFQETTRSCTGGLTFEMASTFPLRGGPHHLAILPPAKAYYIDRLQFERKLLFFVQRSDFAWRPAGTAAERANQALQHAAQRRGAGLFCELAKMSLGWFDKLNASSFDEAARRIHERLDGSADELLAALAILLRDPGSLPLPEARARLQSALANYRYWHDQPGEDGMDFSAESRQIVIHACEILAGQLLPGQVFANSGQRGEWHRQHGEALALDWMRQRGAYGFREWDSPASVERVLAALAQLVELAESEQVRDTALVLIDKVLFSMALNSWRGIYGASRGYADTPGVLSARLESTSGISRLLWGLGNFNEAIMGVVSLALCETYQLPAPVEKIATDPQQVVWARERSSQPETGWEANRVTYRTPDFMLSSAQDYAPGQPGLREHIWQASLGPDAIVYTNHPANLQVETQHEPNQWAGNGVLPRVLQWGDVLLAFYHLPPGDWLGYTHAYFPASAFDEVQLSPSWAFARRGQGYLALFAAQGLQWVQTGPTAMRELRSDGLDNTWICHMGQQVLDGSFEQFQHKILAMELRVEPARLSLTSLRGDNLSAGWDGPLLVNGEAQATSGFLHYESPFCTVDLPAEQMDIVYQDEGVRLKFV